MLFGLVSRADAQEKLYFSIYFKDPATLKTNFDRIILKDGRYFNIERKKISPPSIYIIKTRREFYNYSLSPIDSRIEVKVVDLKGEPSVCVFQSCARISSFCPSEAGLKEQMGCVPANSINDLRKVK
jgi:hypothetical protein